MTAAGPQFGPPGYETDLLYLAALATLVLAGPGPFSVDQRIRRKRDRARTTEQSPSPHSV